MYLGSGYFIRQIAFVKAHKLLMSSSAVAGMFRSYRNHSDIFMGGCLLVRAGFGKHSGTSDILLIGRAVVPRCGGELVE